MNHKKAVARGAALLDRKEPDWHKMVNRIDLDLGSDRRCVCAQIVRHHWPNTGIRYRDWRDYVRLRLDLRSWRQVSRHGFTEPLLPACLTMWGLRKRGDTHYRILTRLWRQEILKRQVARAEVEK